jgi:two-component system, OmpR family, response regulator
MRRLTDPLAVLVVDDSRDCAESLADVLRGHGHDVRTAHTPTEAVLAVEDFRPEAVLMDIGIPGLDGYRLARKVCDRLAYKPLLVAVTGHAHLEERSRAEGFDHHFLKPADPVELVRLLAGHAESRPASDPPVRAG